MRFAEPLVAECFAVPSPPFRCESFGLRGRAPARCHGRECLLMTTRAIRRHQREAIHLCYYRPMLERWRITPQGISRGAQPSSDTFANEDRMLQRMCLRLSQSTRLQAIRETVPAEPSCSMAVIYSTDVRNSGTRDDSRVPEQITVRRQP